MLLFGILPRHYSCSIVDSVLDILYAMENNMKWIISKGFKTLQGRLVVLLLLPVCLIILSGGVASFLFTRNMVLEQWNESALLKLQRAAHYIEMRLMKPIEVVEILLQLSSENKRSIILQGASKMRLPPRI